MLAGLVGTVVHDHWKPYYSLEGVLHALCNAHHLRELQALIDIEKEPRAEAMQRLLRRACHATNLAREHDKPLDPNLIGLIKRRYDAIVADAIAFHEAQLPLPVKRRGSTPRRTGHNLTLRLSLPRGCHRLRRAPLADLHRTKAGMEYPRHPRRRSEHLDKPPQDRLKYKTTWAVTRRLSVRR